MKISIVKEQLGVKCNILGDSQQMRNLIIQRHDREFYSQIISTKTIVTSIILNEKRIKLQNMMEIILVIFFSTLFPTLVTSQSYERFPIHQSEIVIDSLDPRDDPECGKFSNVQSANGRIFNGNRLPNGAARFPWNICIIMPTFEYKRDSDGQRVPPLPYYESLLGIFILYRRWVRACTGSILNEHWIITGAHCYGEERDGILHYISGGSTHCADPHPPLLRRIIVKRKDPFQTIFISSDADRNYRSRQTYATHNDIALIKIFKKIQLPRPYMGQAVNNICFYSTSKIRFDDISCDEAFYFAGYGLKFNQELGELELSTAEDDVRSLTWLTENKSKCPAALRVFSFITPTTCMVHKIANNNFQNPCVGDSGGPYILYPNIRNSGQESTNNPAVSSSRGFLMAILSGALAGDRECENESYEIFNPLGFFSDPQYAMIEQTVSTIENNFQFIQATIEGSNLYPIGAPEETTDFTGLIPYYPWDINYESQF